MHHTALTDFGKDFMHLVWISWLFQLFTNLDYQQNKVLFLTGMKLLRNNPNARNLGKYRIIKLHVFLTIQKNKLS